MEPSHIPGDGFRLFYYPFRYNRKHVIVSLTYMSNLFIYVNFYNYKKNSFHCLIQALDNDKPTNTGNYNRPDKYRPEQTAYRPEQTAYRPEQTAYRPPTTTSAPVYLTDRPTQRPAWNRNVLF